MTDELKKALLTSNIQCINENDGKYVFLFTPVLTLGKDENFAFDLLYNYEIPVGSILILNMIERDSEIKRTLVYVCCNASQDSKTIKSKKNLFWYQITESSHNIIPKKL